MIRMFAICTALTASVVPLSACHHLQAYSRDARESTTLRESDHDHTVLSELNVAMPIAPGKTEAWRQALGELLGPRYQEYEASRSRYGLTSQTTFLQRTRMGDFALIHLTGPDVGKSLHTMSESLEPWDVSWRQLTLDLHGVDFAKGAQVFPKIEALFSVGEGNPAGTQPFMFVAPVTSQGVQKLRAIAREIMGARKADYQAARLRIGVQRESVFLQSGKEGNALVFYWRAPDPQASLKQFITSQNPFDEWLRTIASEVHPLPLDALQDTVMKNTLIADYPRN